MADKELKPCPFCGSTDVELRAGMMFNGAAHCKNCSADVVFDAVRMIAEGDYDWQTAVTNGWNKRAEDVVPRNEVEKWKANCEQLHKEMSERIVEERKIERKLAKQEVAKQIFEEIMLITLTQVDRYGRYLIYENDFAELKKKYIGKDTDVPTNKGK